MFRTPIPLAALAAGLLFIGCSDKGASPSGPESGLIVSEHDELLAEQIRELIDVLFPSTKEKNNLNRAAHNQFDAAEKACHQKSQEDCTEKVFSVIDFVNEKHDEEKLLDPDGLQTTDEGVLELNLLLLQFAGFDVPDFSDVPEDATDFNVQPCLDPAEDCLAIVPSGFSGVFLPEFACDGPCVLVAFRYDETNFVPTDGPLPTDLDQFPLFYDWAKYEVEEEGGVEGAARSLGLAQGEFNVPVEVALCVVEMGDYAPADEIEGRLELAHPDPDNPDEIEFGEDNGNSPNVPIDEFCTDELSGGDPPSAGLAGLAPAGERRLTLASPGKLGQAFTAMSPFAAVDPESGDLVSVSGFDDSRSRAPLDGGTGFDGTSTLMDALLEPDNFGADGTVSCTVEIEPLVATIAPGSLVDGSGNLQVDVFFAGLTATTLTSDEAAELVAFLNAGGVLYLSGNSADNEGPGYNPLFVELDVSDRYGTTLTGSDGESSDPPDTPITNGPFGAIGPLSHSFFRVLLPATTTGLATGFNSESYLLAEGAFQSGYLSWTGDPLYFNLFTDVDQDNLNYFLNLFALGCVQEGGIIPEPQG